MQNFKNLGISDNTIEIIKSKGFEEPTEIQSKTIPLLLNSNKDIIAQSQTGTGKTAAFGLVFMEKIKPGNKLPQAIVLVPTRELAIQVALEINSLKSSENLKIATIYGGADMSKQLRELKRGVDIVVGTPGRIFDHLKRKSLVLSDIKYAVLDEADEMLSMGFIDDIDTILQYANPKRQVLLFSATMPQPILNIAKKYMPDYTLIKAQKNQITTNLINQIYFEVKQRDRFDALCRIIDVEPDFYSLVFCRTRLDVDALSKDLSARGYSAEGLHGDMAQAQRERILGKFRKKTITILVATDVAARGIDVSNLTHVINYGLPQDPEAYVHRIGRTGRAGKTGTAITFVTPAEYYKLSVITRIAKTSIDKKTLPQVEQVIGVKRDKVLKDINDIIESGDTSFYENLVDTLFKNIDPKKALAAVLKHSFADKLNPQKYKKISAGVGDRSARGDRKSHSRDFDVEDGSTHTRLFIAMGRKHDIGPRSLVEMIVKQTKINQRLIEDVTVCNEFSFVTVPFKEASTILNNLKCPEGKIRKLVQKATGKKSGDGGSSRGGSRGERKPKRKDSRNTHKSEKKRERKTGNIPASKGPNRAERRKGLQRKSNRK